MKDEFNQIIRQIWANPVPTTENLAKVQRAKVILRTWAAVAGKLVTKATSLGTEDVAREIAALSLLEVGTGSSASDSGATDHSQKGESTSRKMQRARLYKQIYEAAAALMEEAVQCVGNNKNDRNRFRSILRRIMSR